MFAQTKAPSFGGSKIDLPFTLATGAPVGKGQSDEPLSFDFGLHDENRNVHDYAPHLLSLAPSRSIDCLQDRRPTLRRTKTQHGLLPSETPLSSAINHFLAALTIDDEHLPARLWLGRCYYQQGRYEMARAELERATRSGRIRGRKSWAAWHQLGLAHQALQQYERAQECFSVALSLEVSTPPLMSMRSFEVLPRYV